MSENLQIVIDYLENSYAAFVELCGEDDEVNTLPCKQALDAAKEIAMIS